jgi:2-hydroxy-3-oxopropionate reductase
MFRRLLSARGQSRSAKTVEVFGWLILIEGTIVLFAPDFAISVLGIARLNADAANYFRLVGLLVCGVGMLYVASGRLNAEGFVFASLLDRPLVPFAMAILWYREIVPGALALIFSIQDFGSFLWTLLSGTTSSVTGRERNRRIDMSNPVLGFIGLGIMGKPMARNLLKAGHQLIVHNRSRDAVEELRKEGAQAATTSKEVAERSEIIITMLPDSPDVELVYAGDQGIFPGVKSQTLLIDMSSISPAVARRLAVEAEKRGCDMLDAPVSGGEAGAIGATLSIMIGGEASAVERAMPIFQTLGKNIVHVGGAGAGQVTKAANQMVVGTSIAIVGEALVLAAKAGVDPAKVRQALLGGFAQSKILEAHGQKMLERNFKPGFRIRLHEKDLKIALATGSEYGVPLMVTGVVAQMMTAMKGTGNGDLDHSGLVKFVEELAQRELGRK